MINKMTWMPPWSYAHCAATLAVPLIAVLLITTANAALAYADFAPYGYFSPYIAVTAWVASRKGWQVGVLTSIASFGLWFWAIVPPAFEFGRWPHAAEWTALGSALVTAVLVAPRPVAPGAGGLTDRLPRSRGYLPFVKPRVKDPNGEDRDAFWAVDRPREWAEADEMGRQYGCIYIDVVRESSDRSIPLSWVLRDMIRQGRFSGVEAGFAAVLEQSLKRAPRLPLRLAAADLLKHHDAQNSRLH